MTADEAGWLEWRRGGITGTDIARWWTGQYGGAYGAVADKLGRGLPQETTPQQARGKAWEDRLARLAETATGLHAHATGEHQVWAEHPDHPHHRATPDGLLSEAPDVWTAADLAGALETKTRAVGVTPNRDYWTAQIQWGLHVSGLPWCLLVDATIDDVDDRLVAVRLDRIDADPFVQDQLVAGAEWLWAHVQAGELPPPDAPSALDYVKLHHQQADDQAGTVEFADLDLVAAVHRYAEIGAAVKAVTDERDQLAATLRHALAGATKAVTPDGWRVSLSAPSRILTPEARDALAAAHPDLVVTRTELDVDRLKTEHPDEYQAAKTPEGSRSLRVYPPKGSKPEKKSRRGGPTTPTPTPGDPDHA